jgi:hypothetical protein
MAKDKPQQQSNSCLVKYLIRIPRSYPGRAKELIPHIEQNEFLISMGRVTTASVLRLALAWGLDHLESLRDDSKNG